MKNDSKAGFKKGVLAAAVAALAGMSVQSAEAANWLQLYNTSPPGVAKPVKVWGFIQPDYATTSGNTVSGLQGPPSVRAFDGAVPNFNLIGPNLSSTNTFNLLRGRIGVRGTLSPLDNKLDYFFLTEFGNNAMTHFAGDHPVVSDAFVTWNVDPQLVRFSLGLQKVPGGWESRVGIPVLPFVNYTTATLQNTLERFISPSTAVTSAGNGGYQFIPSSSNVTGFGSFRDVGLKVFNWFDRGPWEYAYAFMVGNGGPITSTNNNNGMDTYGMLRASYVFSGKGPYRNDAGVWVWFHNGQRKIDQIGTYKLNRWGFGGEYGRHQRQAGGYIMHAGYMQASGWILAPAPFQYDASVASQYTGPALGGYNNLTQWTIYPGSDNKAWGAYIQGGYYVTHNIQLQLRYDQYNRLTNNAALERDFKTWTVGAQYFLTPGTRLSLNYAIQKLDVPHPGAITNPVQRNNAQQIANSMGNRLDLELTAVF
ncbi:hypothetical protein BJI67_03005 [Acidihalobacter aeolianus]|uniref:Porin n=1 Tax=Acidihalobacter aeolianus TaxID=2792603 RepID=A0A1D8K5D2_9GAMM|nr:hypothetical protein [Acidihalobacter aeolianus]AOV16171.1 hypothetical protein BJI67_03005 [Acidihalobacter aeolianus]